MDPVQSNKKPTEHPILTIVARTITDHGMVRPGESVLVGVSGGPDSVALFHILRGLARQLDISLAIGHLNHDLRGDASVSDARFAETLAAEFNVPFYAEKRDVRQYGREQRLSLEEAAREVRYSFLLKIAENFAMNRIALGHHADDNAESILMHLFRGSGSQGITGIPPVRDHRIIRPLIMINKKDILGYLNETGLGYVLDKTNSDRTHMRNRIRYDLIPMIESSVHPRVTETLNRIGRIIRDEEDWLTQLIEPIFRNLVVAHSDTLLALSIDGLHGMHPALQRRILRKAVLAVNGSLRRISFGHIEAVRQHLNRRVNHSSIDLPNRIRVSKTGRKLVFSKEEKPLRQTVVRPGPPCFDLPVTCPGTVTIKEINVRLGFSRIQKPKDIDVRNAGHHIAFFDINKVTFPLNLRNVRRGDRFSPMGMTGTQKIKDFFINNKIPREDRWKYPLLLSGGKIIWVVGLRIDESVRVTSATQTVLRAEMLLPDAV